jgi:probable HAF family extracellular repeat protein
MRLAVSKHSPLVRRSSFGSFAVRAVPVARGVLLAAVTLALIACRDGPTEPTLIATPGDGPQFTLVGGAGTLIFPVATPGNFQPIGFAIGLNNSGQVTGAGRFNTTQDANKPYRWTPGGAPVQLIGCCDSQFGVDINDAGVVVGSADVSATVGRRGFVATGTSMVPLSILPGAPADGEARAIAVNEAGQIVGMSSTASATTHAVLWSPSLVIQDLGTLGGSRSTAVDINDAGQVIGTSLTAGDAATHAFRWSSGTGMQDLNSLVGANITDVVAINDAGQIVGTYTAPGGQSHAFRYTPGVGLRDLGTLGGTFSVPTGVNGKGDVVGSSAIAGGAAHAFLWTETDGLEDVTAITGVLEVSRLNDNLETLTGTRAPTSLVLESSTVTPRLVQLKVTQSDSPPIALFTASCNGLTCTLDATGSIDDKPGLTYSWNLNKYPEGSATGAIVKVTYPHSNPRTVTLTVTDSKGQSSSSSQTLPVSDFPIAAFSDACTGLTCNFDSSGSTNDGDLISNRIWFFGDGKSDGTGKTAIAHAYAAAGTYTVTLEIWGTSANQRAVVARQITVTAAAQNQPPFADFTWSCVGTVCMLDASSSIDDKGIVSYAWSLGKSPDGTASGVRVTTDYWHTSTRTVTLTVTDAEGLTNSITKTFDVGAPADARPVARFTSSCNGTVCTMNASTSTDDVGITSYAWSLGKFPDNSASGVTVTTDYWHTSTRTVTLTVTDTKGQTNSVTKTVNVP